MQVKHTQLTRKQTKESQRRSRLDLDCL